MDIKKIKSSIWINDYIITFSYITARKSQKTQSRVTTHTEDSTLDFAINDILNYGYMDNLLKTEIDNYKNN